jgi:hypothetical protein
MKPEKEFDCVEMRRRFKSDFCVRSPSLAMRRPSVDGPSVCRAILFSVISCEQR